MNADDFRHFYEYHFTINHKIWNECVVPLTDEQFSRRSQYSIGSVRNQVVHMLSIDDRWFSGLRGETVPDFLSAEHYTQRPLIREKWDSVENKMRDYLQTMRDEDLQNQPFLKPDGDTTRLWQVLLHVVNHGTDHRAQLLSLLDQLGMNTFPQDYFFFVIGRM
jgi:uncharacterized damage-inducible protein DinB